MATTEFTGVIGDADHQGMSNADVAAPADRLAVDFARWASRPYRAESTIEGYRLLRVLRILARPAYGLKALTDEAARLERLVKQGDAAGWNARRRAATEAERAADAAYTVILRDVDTLFAELTGLDASSIEGLSAELPLAQLAAEAHKLTATRVASHYRSASAHYRELAVSCAVGMVEKPAGVDFDALLNTQDEVDMCHRRPALAGRLDLIGGGV